MQNFIELLKDHALLLSAGRSLADIVAPPDPAPGPAFDALRRLARLLAAHLHAEAEFIRLDGENVNQEFAALSASHGALFDELVAEWTTYLNDWNAERIAQDWPTFGADTRRILARLATQLETENQSLYPAALKYGLIRLLPETLRDTMEERPAA